MRSLVLAKHLWQLVDSCSSAKVLDASLQEMWLLLLLASGLQALRVEDDPLTLQVGDWLPEDDNHTVRFAHALEPDYAMEAKLEAAVAAPAHNVSELLMDIGGGTGAGAGTGDLDMDKDQLRRMRYQDKARLIKMCQFPP